MAFLKVSGISMKGDGDFALRDISFSQRKFQKIAIAGETGSGKSSLMKIIAGLIQSDAGEILLENEKVKGPADKLVPGNPEIAYLSQHFELPHSLRVEQILSYANLLSAEAANALYEICKITHLLKRRTDELSGGERQRIALTTLLITSPKLVLLDEPFSNLDMVLKGVLKSVIKNIGERLKITCILVSHDPLDTLSWAESMIIMKEGKIIQKGSPEKIYNEPVNEYVAGLFGRYNLISAEAIKSFVKSSRIKPGKKGIFIRPENFKLVPKSDKSFSGKVTDVKFFGNHCELDVAINGQSIIIRTDRSDIKIGSRVNLSLSLRK